VAKDRDRLTRKLWSVRLVLSTIHSAKGQEWRTVYILNVVDGCIPSDMATTSPAEIEEERRLLYVAMTRAKDDLHLICPHRFFTHQQPSVGDRHVYASRARSRWIRVFRGGQPLRQVTLLLTASRTRC
jgi:superfamily I DNA/RNA helicase